MQTWMQLTDSIFQNKHKYKNFIDKDKEDSFYIINKKFSLGKLKIAQMFNHKSIDRASAMDLWFLVFKKTNITPGWYWAKKPINNQEKIKKISKGDKELLMSYEQLNENEFDFLYENYKDDVEYKIKLLKRFEK